jgi:hypothetical protein
MNPFEVKTLTRPGLLRRMIGSKLRENAFVEIENLLASKSLENLAAAEIINILSDYGIPRDEAMPTLAKLYEKAIWHSLRDATLSDVERKDLTELRYVLDLEETVAAEVQSTVLRWTFREQLKKALDDEELSEVEKQKLEDVAENFSFSKTVKTDIYKEEVLAVMQEAFKRAVMDRRLTPAEELRLAKMGENLGIEITHDHATLITIKRLKLLARIDVGELPTIEPSLRLQRGEVCHAEFPCRLHEYRVITRGVAYHGPTGRIRIMKGLSWRYGYISATPVRSEELRQLDSGTLYITNKRLLFNGSRRSVNTQLKKIIHFTAYQDGIQIEKDSGRDQFFLGSGDLELVSEILESALRHAS